MKCIVYLCFTMCLIISCNKDNAEKDCHILRNKDTYEYSIKPGTDEWEKLNTSQEIINACQIPLNLLNIISTEGLIESTLNNPMFGDIYLSDVNIQHGFNAFYENFNGIQELFKREDASAKLIIRYNQMDPACINNNWPSLVKPGYNNNYSFSFIEIIMAQYPIISQIIDSREENSFLQKIMSKYENKKIHNYSYIGLEHSALIAGRIMYLFKYEPFIAEYNANQHIQDFINGAMLLDYKSLDIITQYAKEFLIKNKK